jgi:hypothetical protein
VSIKHTNSDIELRPIANTLHYIYISEVLEARVRLGIGFGVVTENRFLASRDPVSLSRSASLCRPKSEANGGFPSLKVVDSRLVIAIKIACLHQILLVPDAKPLVPAPSPHP